MKEWDIVDLLRHDRHDWLNHIQLIKAYLSLGNIEKVEEVIDRVIEQANQQSKLSNLDCPRFAGLLLTYHWEKPEFPLEYEVIGAGKLDKSFDSDLTLWFEEFFSVLESNLLTDDETPISIYIYLDREVPQIQINVSGRFDEAKGLEQFLNQSKLTVENRSISSDSALIELALK